MGVTRIEVRLWNAVNGRQIERFIRDYHMRSQYSKVMAEDSTGFSPNHMYSSIIVEDETEHLAERTADLLRKKFDGF